MKHRIRAEYVAPWLLMIVVALMWWGGARLVHRLGVRELLPATPRAAASAPAASARASGAVTSVPPPRAVVDPLPAAAVRPDAEDPEARPLSAAGLPVITFQDITDLRERRLTVPVQGVTVDALVSSYRDARDATRRHEAMDIMAARGTPVVAVEHGSVAKLFDSRLGGLTVYQFDPSERFVYYYAHLDGYAEGLADGDRVERGQLLGYVGTTGNAPANAPHLHFAIAKLGAERRWWDATPLDPYVIWR